MRFLLLFVLLTPTSFAEETILVTATRLSTPTSGVASANSAIAPSSNESGSARDASEWLRDLPGTQVRTNGGLGQPQFVYIRGGNADHTLVLIDGITANDPMSVNGAFDFGNLDPWGWGQVELVRGPQSGLYGSEAMAGVVQFFSPEPKKGEKEVKLGAEIGTYDTRRVQGSFQKRFDTGSIFFSAHHLQSAGFSAASKIYGNREEDAAKRDGVSIKLTKDLTDKSDIKAIAHYTDSRAELDTQGGELGDSFSLKAHNRTLLSRAQLRTFFNEDTDGTIGINFTQHKRDYTDPNSFFVSEVTKADWQHNWSFLPEHTLSAGLDASVERGESFDIAGIKEENLTGVFLQHSFRGKAFFSSLAARHDWYQAYGNINTFKAAPGFKVTQTTTLKGSYGTAFKAPSLYQKYSTYGNLNLKAERSQAWDAGVEQQLGQPENLLGLRYFSQRYKELIIAGPAPSYKNENIGSAKTMGWELNSQLGFWNLGKFEASVTRLSAYNESTGRYLVRRPDWAGKALVDWRVAPGASVWLRERYVGKRDDVDASPTSSLPKQMPAYYVTDLGSRLNYDDTWSFSVHLENAFNKDYEDIAGFGTPGRSVYAQIQAQL